MRTAGLVAERFHGFGCKHADRSAAGRFFDLAKRDAGYIANPKWHVESVATRCSESIANGSAGSGAERLAGCVTAKWAPNSSPERLAG